MELIVPGANPNLAQRSYGGGGGGGGSLSIKINMDKRWFVHSTLTSIHILLPTLQNLLSIPHSNSYLCCFILSMQQ